MVKKINKNKEKNIAKERIQYLFEKVEKIAKKQPKLAKKYIELIINIAKKHNIRLNKSQKLLFCKNCHSAWIFGENVHARLNKTTGCIEYICDNCGYIKRVRYK